jgi:hypothetical protein
MTAPALARRPPARWSTRRQLAVFGVIAYALSWWPWP